MTLTALTKNGKLFNPSASIFAGRDELKVITQVRLAQNKGLFCPHCFAQTGEYYPVKFRNTQTRAKHFYHLADVEHARECQNYSTESDKHMAAVMIIGDTLSATSPTDIEVDNLWMESDGVTRRKPDVWIRRGDRIEVHEIQVSPISLEDLQQRSSDLKQHGASSVSWYLYGGNYNRSNRLWAKRNRVQVYHLWFEDSDIRRPTWRLDDGVGLQDEPRSSDRDRCHLKDTASSNAAKAQLVTRENLTARFQKQQQVAQSVVQGDITHIRKPGWFGVIYERPWNSTDMIDVQWIQAPEGKDLPLSPSRYPIADIRRNGEVLQ